MNCTRCQRRIPDELVRCPHCGQRSTEARLNLSRRPARRPPPSIAASVLLLSFTFACIMVALWSALHVLKVPDPQARPSRPSTSISAPTSPVVPDDIPVLPASPAIVKPLVDNGRPDKSEAGKRNEEGVRYYQEGRFAEALERFQSGLRLKPDSPVLKRNAAYSMANLGWLELQSSRPDSSLEKFLDATAVHPEEPLFHFGAGLAYHRLGKDDRAVEAIREGLVLDPEQPEGLTLLGDLSYLRDDLDMAIDAWRKALNRQPEDVSLRNRLAKATRERDAQSSFKIRQTGHFTVKFEGRQSDDVARQITALLEEAYEKVGVEFSVYPRDPITVVLYSSEQFRDVTRTPGWAGGIFDGKIRLPIDGAGQNPELLKRVLYHEYTHAVIYSLAGRGMPTWLNEGLALLLEGGPRDRPEDLRLLISAREKGDLPTLRRLEGSFLDLDPADARLAYAESFFAVRFLVDRYGMPRVRELLEAMGQGKSFDKAMTGILHLSYGEFEEAWIRHLS